MDYTIGIDNLKKFTYIWLKEEEIKEKPGHETDTKTTYQKESSPESSSQKSFLSLQVTSSSFMALIPSIQLLTWHHYSMSNKHLKSTWTKPNSLFPPYIPAPHLFFPQYSPYENSILHSVIKTPFLGQKLGSLSLTPRTKSINKTCWLYLQNFHNLSPFHYLNHCYHIGPNHNY